MLVLLMMPPILLTAETATASSAAPAAAAAVFNAAADIAAAAFAASEQASNVLQLACSPQLSIGAASSIACKIVCLTEILHADFGVFNFIFIPLLTAAYGCSSCDVKPAKAFYLLLDCVSVIEEAIMTAGPGGGFHALGAQQT